MKANSTSHHMPFQSLVRSAIFRRLFFWFFIVNVCVLLASVLIAEQLHQDIDTPYALRNLATQQIMAAWRKNGQQGVDQLRIQWRSDYGMDVFLERDGKFLTDQQVPRPAANIAPRFDDSTLQQTLLNGELLVAEPFTMDGKLFHAVLFQSFRPTNRWSVTQLLTVQLLASLLAIAIVGALIARHFSEPLAATQTAVQRIGDGNLQTRVDARVTTRHDEFGQLAEGVNDMASRLELLIADRNRLLHDVSHELRSPLARLRLLLELARSDEGAAQLEQLNRADTEIGRIDYLVDEVLNYARTIHIRREQLQPVNLYTLARSAVDSAQVEADARTVRLELHGNAATILGDAESLHQALDNLLRNAIRFSPTEGVINIKLTQHDQHVTLSVTDQGPGVPESQLAQIFQPFIRIPGNERGKGYGLGLALVQRVAELHGAELKARNVVPHGLEVSLQLPLASTVTH